MKDYPIIPHPVCGNLRCDSHTQLDKRRAYDFNYDGPCSRRQSWTACHIGGLANFMWRWHSIDYRSRMATARQLVECDVVFVRDYVHVGI